jgi:hypothetical protein
MNIRVEEDTYKQPRRYVFIATLIVIAVLFALPFLI